MCVCVCRGVYELNKYSSLAVNRKSFGLAAANLSDPQNGMKTVWLILGVEWVIFMLAAWYLEQVGGLLLCAVPLCTLGQAGTGRCMRATRRAARVVLLEAYVLSTLCAARSIRHGTALINV